MFDMPLNMPPELYGIGDFKKYLLKCTQRANTCSPSLIKTIKQCSWALSWCLYC